MTYTAEQLAAIESKLPITIVEAGAGSGKTATLAGRAAHLVRDRGVGPEHVLCLTFTRAAASEIRSRIDAELGRDAGVRVETFHAFAASLCVSKGWRVATELESKAAIKSLYEGPTRLPRGDVPGIKMLRRLIVEHEAEPAGAATVALVLGRLAEGRLIPTWDLVPRLMATRHYGLYRHVLVDECQDVTPGELRLAAALGSQDLFAVLDSRQAIMQWRGAVGWSREPTRRLTQTFRFGREIAEYANGIAERFGGEPIEGADVGSFVAEVLDVWAWLDKWRRGFEPAGKVLILARTRHECAQLERDLRGLAVWAKRDPLDPMASDADRFEDIWDRGLAVISTVHAAKGREADTVIACLRFEDDGSQEENKIRYVAATRARRRLLLAGPPGDGSPPLPGVQGTKNESDRKNHGVFRSER